MRRRNDGVGIRANDQGAVRAIRTAADRSDGARAAGDGGAADERSSGANAGTCRRAHGSLQRTGRARLSRPGAGRQNYFAGFSPAGRAAPCASPSKAVHAGTCPARGGSFAECAASSGRAGLSSADCGIYRRSRGTGLSRAIAGALRQAARPATRCVSARVLHASR